MKNITTDTNKICVQILGLRIATCYWEFRPVNKVDFATPPHIRSLHLFSHCLQINVRKILHPSRNSAYIKWVWAYRSRASAAFVARLCVTWWPAESGTMLVDNLDRGWPGSCRGCCKSWHCHGSLSEPTWRSWAGKSWKKTNNHRLLILVLWWKYRQSLIVFTSWSFQSECIQRERIID